jgi:hypothetical protein
MTQARKGRTVDTTALTAGELLHIYFAFWGVPSRRGFTAMLVIVDAKTKNHWLFFTASNKYPLHTVCWLFVTLRRDKRNLAWIRVDEYVALIGSAPFCRYICDD